MNMITLSPRLEKIAQLVPKCHTVADIGTDHAYIPVRLVQSGTAQCAIASDIKKGPVARAEETVKRYGLEEKINIRLGAGLSTIRPEEAEAIIIAGMGGILISEILKTSQNTVRTAKTLILQPMTAVYELREYLSENNYSVTDEFLVREEDKLYNIIIAKPSGSNSYSLKELYLGKYLAQTSPMLFDKYRESIITKLNKRVNGLKKSGRDENISAAERLSGIIHEITR